MLDGTISPDMVVSNNLDTDSEEFKLLDHIYKDIVKTARSASAGGAIEVTIESEIPLGAGMGSSAAWGAALSCALLHTLFFILNDG